MPCPARSGIGVHLQAILVGHPTYRESVHVHLLAHVHGHAHRSGHAVTPSASVPGTIPRPRLIRPSHAAKSSRSAKIAACSGGMGGGLADIRRAARRSTSRMSSLATQAAGPSTESRPPSWRTVTYRSKAVPFVSLLSPLRGMSPDP